MTEQIKRFRITNTPGELRLQKDMKELSGRTDVQFHYPEEPGSVVLTFQSHPLYLYVPAVFRVNVPRFYPHNAPTVQCLDEEYSATGTVTCPYILPTGELLHEGLGEAWSAIGRYAYLPPPSRTRTPIPHTHIPLPVHATFVLHGSLATVVDIIHSVRASLQQNPHLVVQHHGNPEMFHAPRGSSSSSSNNNGGGGQGGPDAMQSSPPSSSSASAPGGGAGADASSGAGPGGSHEYLMQTGPWTGDSVARVEFMSVPPMRPMHADAMDADIMMDGDTDDDATGIP